MSYINMDHAGWVQRNLEAAKRHLTAADIRRGKEKHAGWGAAPDRLNDFHERAFTILGIVGGGIYNAPFSWDTVQWWPNSISVAWFKSFATYDFSDLTRFVLLCHEARIRGEIAPCSSRYLRIHLHERKAEGGVSREHPNLVEMIEEWRADFPTDHRVIYRKPDNAAASAPMEETQSEPGVVRE